MVPVSQVPYPLAGSRVNRPNDFPPPRFFTATPVPAKPLPLFYRDPLFSLVVIIGVVGWLIAGLAFLTR